MAKGSIGKCTVLQDCFADEAENLMFLKVGIEFTFNYLRLSYIYTWRRMTISPCSCSSPSWMGCIWSVFTHIICGRMHWCTLGGIARALSAVFVALMSNFMEDLRNL